MQYVCINKYCRYPNPLVSFHSIGETVKKKEFAFENDTLTVEMIRGELFQESKRVQFL